MSKTQASAPMVDAATFWLLRNIDMLEPDPRDVDVVGIRQQVAGALAAALDAAAAVEGWWWCGHIEELVDLLSHEEPTREGIYCDYQPCPGPHYQLLIGPEA